MTAFDHEKLDVYQAALEFDAAADEIVAHFPPGRHDLSDQLNRASTSIVLNIAEGAGEFSRAEKVRFYRMAKRSATECAAALDVGRIRRLIDDKHREAGRSLLLRIVSMLIRMIHSIESGTGKGTGTGMDRQDRGIEEVR
jgi:four helix bundle protein